VFHIDIFWLLAREVGDEFGDDLSQPSGRQSAVHLLTTEQMAPLLNAKLTARGIPSSLLRKTAQSFFMLTAPRCGGR
jgi:hypothetical protein